MHDLSAMGAGQEEEEEEGGRRKGGGKGRTSVSPLGLHKTDLAGEVGEQQRGPP